MRNKLLSFIPISFFLGIFIYAFIITSNGCNDNDINSDKINNNEHQSGHPDDNKKDDNILENETNDLKNEYNFKDFIQKKGISMILFYLEDCGPCKRFKSDFYILEKEYKNKVSFAMISLGTTEELKKETEHLYYDYDISTFPSISIFKNGERIKVFEGDENRRDLNNLRTELNKFLDK